MAGRMIVLALLLALASSARAADAGFDLFVFVRSYSPTFCKEEVCSIRPISAFTIHGLWPEYNNGNWPQFCGGDVGGSGGELAGAAAGVGSDGAAAEAAEQPQQQEQQQHGAELGVIVPVERRHRKGPGQGPGSGGSSGGDDPTAGGEPSQQQKCEWPSFKGPDRGFWDHEWERHGTCARPITGDRAAFFNTTIALHNTYDLDTTLSAAGIGPSDTQSYRTSDIKDAIEDAFGARPLLSCFHGQLLELWLCVGLDLKVKDCPKGVLNSHRETCGRTVSLPAGSPVPPECRSYIPPWSAPSGGGGDNFAVRIATGVAVAGAAAAAAALFVAGAARRERKRRQRLADAVAEPYDPLERFLNDVK